jgi:O-antigen ligase
MTIGRTGTEAAHRAVGPGSTWDTILFSGFLALLAWVPFWFGSNSAFAWGVNAVLVASLVSAYELGLLVRGLPHPVGLRRIRVPALCLALVVAWILVQMSPLAPEGWHHPIWAMTAEALGRPLAGSISVNHDLTALALMRLLTCAGVFWLALQLCRENSRAHRLLVALAVIGSAYALYGIIAFFVAPGDVLWLPGQNTSGALSATFVGRNNYATYAGVMCVVCLALVLGRLHGVGRASSWQMRIAEVVAAIVGQAGLAFVALCLISVALLLTVSRAGITASFVALGATLVLSGITSRTGRVWLMLGSIPILLVLVALFAAFGERYLAGLEQLGSRTDDRMAAYIITLTSIVTSPFTGFGYGTFEHAFRMFRDGSLTGGLEEVWDKAHNTYLEVFQGLGLIGGGVLILGVGLLALRCLVGVFTRKQDVAAPLAATGATLLVSLHALVDFSLQIQAVAITWIALLGAGVAQSWSSRAATSDAARRA